MSGVFTLTAKMKGEPIYIHYPEGDETKLAWTHNIDDAALTENIQVAGHWFWEVNRTALSALADGGVVRIVQKDGDQLKDVVLPVLHLKTQRNQPYGSERRCCEECGVMIWNDPPAGHFYTENPQTYDEAELRGYRKCRNVPEEECYHK